MSLTHETTIIKPGYQVGDVKLVSYDIIFTAGQIVEPSNDPGWFLLNGAAISRTAYPTLFARFGTAFGAGDGSTTFNLPNHTEGTFPIGTGLSNFTSYGGSGGEIAHVLSLGEMPVHSHSNTLGVSAGSHAHSASGTTDYGGGHTHTYSRGFTQASTPSGSSTQISSTGYPTTSSSEGSHTHGMASFSAVGNTESYNKGGSISNAGSSSAHNNMMPYIVIGGLLVKHD